MSTKNLNAFRDTWNYNDQQVITIQNLNNLNFFGNII